VLVASSRYRVSTRTYQNVHGSAVMSIEAQACSIVLFLCDDGGVFGTDWPDKDLSSHDFMQRTHHMECHPNHVRVRLPPEANAQGKVVAPGKSGCHGKFSAARAPRGNTRVHMFGD
jgi:hypothetical protein